jgi:bifunctional non-homologous end joining protein LigD
MINGLKKLHPGEPACQKRSDSDHLRFVIHRKGDDLFDFSIELNGIKSWAVPGVPSMNPLDQKTAKEEKVEAQIIFNAGFEQTGSLPMWDKGNYIPIDDYGNALSEYEAIESLKEGILKFFLQGTKLVGEFVLMKKGKKSWLLMKRHDEFALYTNYNFETVTG